MEERGVSCVPGQIRGGLRIDPLHVLTGRSLMPLARTVQEMVGQKLRGACLGEKEQKGRSQVDRQLFQGVLL